MTNFTPYLLCDGNCTEIMSFYKTCFGGELSLMKVGDSPMKDRMPKEMHGKVINSRLKSGVIDISASDWLLPDRVRKPGNTVCLYVSGGTSEELAGVFNKLLVDASVIDPLNEQFFGTYGALTDKYGVRWMFQGAGSMTAV